MSTSDSASSGEAPGACGPMEAEILGAGRKVVLATAGGGSGVIGRLLVIPGSSQTVLEAVALQAEKSFSEWIGRRPDQFCSEQAARSMAMASWRRAIGLTDGTESGACVGIGVTASLATTKPKRGDHRIHVAVQTADTTTTLSLTLDKGARSRAEEEAVAERSVLAMLADTIGARAMDLSKTPPGMIASSRRQDAHDEWRDLLLGERASVRAGLAEDAPLRLLIPGSFNPLHAGHEEIARVASEAVGAEPVFELSIANVDKPPLDYLELVDRVAGVGDRPLLLTSAPTFIEKARLAPGCVFGIGVDTLVRLADPRYCPRGEQQRDEQFDEMASLGCRFLVFGRHGDEVFSTLHDVAIPETLRSLCDGFTEQEFRVDVSSTELRDTSD